MKDSPNPKESSIIAAELFFVDGSDLSKVKYSFSDNEITLDGPVERDGWYIGLPKEISGRIDTSKDILHLGNFRRGALISYISSSLFPGIGKQTAEKIVKTLKRDELIAMLRGEKTEFEELDTPKSVIEALVATWEERQGEHAWSILMHELRFTPQQQAVIRDKLGVGIIPLLRENPFALLGNIPRFDFEQATELCDRFGIEVSDKERAIAAANYWLEEKVERQRRNTCGSLEGTVREVSRMAKLGQENALEYITADEKAFHVGKRNDKTVLSTRRSAKRDAALARELKRLIATRDEPGNLLFEAESLEASVDLTGEQVEAINLAINNPVCIVTGGPGAGKTAMVQGLVNALTQQGKEIQICAPTGRAAKRIAETPGLSSFNPSTIHMHLTRHEDRETSQDFMIIDESSMIDIDLMVRLLRSIPDGCSVVFIGDADQLPPVGPGQPFKDMIDSDTIPVARLTGNFRQDSFSETIKAARAVISGNVPSLNSDLDASDFVFIECPEEDQADRILELYFDILPEMLGNKFTDNQILAPQRTRHVGISLLNQRIQARLFSDKKPILTRGDGDSEMRIHVGDKVINGENNYQLRVMNGDVGTVMGERGGQLVVKFDMPGGSARDVKFPNMGRHNLEPAYALTIHKSQGSEYPGVIIPVAGAHLHMLSRSLLYTAITRGQRKVCLVGERQALEKSLEWYTKDSRYTLLADELAGAGLARAF